MEQTPKTQTNAPAQDKVFSQMMKAGGKNYFFDVKKASNGTNYLTIAESYQKKTGEKVMNRLLIFKDHFPAFTGVLEETKQYLQ
jgi:hypothetical protein